MDSENWIRDTAQGSDQEQVSSDKFEEALKNVSRTKVEYREQGDTLKQKVSYLSYYFKPFHYSGIKPALTNEFNRQYYSNLT